jgi:hypothetical protein
MADVPFIEETINQGDNHTITTTVLDAEDNPMDLNTGSPECNFYLGRDWGTDPSITKTLASGISATAQGVATITLSDEDTAALNHTHRYPWTMWAKPDSGTLRMVARGVLHVRGTVRAAS